MQRLLNFDVSIQPGNGGYYTRVVASPTGEAYAEFALPFSDQDLQILALKVATSVGRARRQARRIQSQERQLLEDFGGQLFQAAFSGAVRDCLDRSRRRPRGRTPVFAFVCACRRRWPTSLGSICTTGVAGFIGLSPRPSWCDTWRCQPRSRPFPISPPLRILAMISAPSDVPELQGEQEWGKLRSAVGDLTGRGMVEVDRLETGTLAALQRPLRLHEYHVLHFVGHGVYDEDAQDGALALEGTDGRTRLVTGRDLGVMLRGHRSLRLVVLNACEGARSARDDPFGGVAQALVRQGIPAVIAMQFEISDPAALVFSQSFYQAIADGLPVDLAMVEARMAMFAEGNEVEWATPVLYLALTRWPRLPVGPDPRRRTAGSGGRRGAAGGRRPTARPGKNAERQAREEAERRGPGKADRQAQEDAERRVKDLDTHYGWPAPRQKAAADRDQALMAFTMITELDPGYRDARERAEYARKQQLVARLTTEVRTLHQAGRWAAVEGWDSGFAISIRLLPTPGPGDLSTSRTRHRRANRPARRRLSRPRSAMSMPATGDRQSRRSSESRKLTPPTVPRPRCSPGRAVTSPALPPNDTPPAPPPQTPARALAITPGPHSYRPYRECLRCGVQP